MQTTIEYYLMRHAGFYDFENQYVSYCGMLILKNSMDRLLIELKDKFPNKKLRIIHSVLPRAKHTALLMCEILVPKGVSVLLTGDPRLNSDMFKIDDLYINEVISSCEKENEICIILSHYPDIEYFCKKELETSEYICKTIELNERLISESIDDDLPF